MYIVKWNDCDTSREVICDNNRTAWEVYKALKKLYESFSSPVACYITIRTTSGVPCNPESGSKLTPCKANEPTNFLLVASKY